MTNFEKFNFYLVQLSIIGLMIYAAWHTGQIKKLENKILNIREQATVDIGQNDTAYKQLHDLRDQDEIFRAEIDTLWLQDDAMWNLHQHDMVELSKETDILEFPWISQKGNGARLYEEDCASAALLMVLQWYGIIDSTYSVDVLHTDMMGGDYAVDWVTLNNFIQDKYGLETTVFVSEQPLKDNLEAAGEDVSEIEVLFGPTPFDVPVLWIYAQTPHWIVRYGEWAYDPAQGMMKLVDIPNLYMPDRGLGIIIKGD